MPLCYRCTGLYIGAALALLLAPIRPRPSATVLWVHGTFMLQMLPFGYHLIEHGVILRLITGQLFGYGLIYYLLLLPAQSRSDSSSRISAGFYFTLVFSAIAGLLAAVSRAPHRVVPVLTVLSLLGLTAIVVMTVVNLAIFAKVTALRLRDSTKSRA